MRVSRKQVLFFSVSVLSASFLSSCGKSSSPLPENNLNERAQFASDRSQPSSKFCTDLNDDKKNPLGKYQWHLRNTGQTAFATRPGLFGADINAASALKEDCLSGDGVYVAVVDSGLEIAHPSLAPNVDNKEHVSKTWSLNYRKNNLGKNDPSPIAEDDSDHGTMVSGIIGMRSNLGFGGSGVAPKAHLAGYNVINSGVQTFQNFLDSLGASDASKGNDIFSMSYGFSNTSQISESNTLVSSAVTAFKTGTRNLRNGKGALYVKAAGNGFSRLGGFMAYYYCQTAVEFGVSCQNSNMNVENTMPEVITVGAVNALGVKSSYSTTGASLWISAPGGEYGVDKPWVEKNYTRLNRTIDWSKYRVTVGEPAIITTDVSGTRYGHSKHTNLDNADEILNIGNEFNACQVSENEDCNYTNSMNGTSSATPVTSGSIALILEANPNLTWRDVKYILAKTATKLDPDLKPISVNLPEGEYQLEQGWVQNAAGFSFSNWYGFGRVNVGEAVKLAKNYNVNLGKYIDQDWFPKFFSTANLLVKQGDLNGVELKINIPKSETLTVESVQLRVTAESRYIGDVAFELTSPSGTKSIVWNAGNGFAGNGNLADMPLQSNAFYGENSAGEWKLKVVNIGKHKADATFKGWKIKISGHK